MAASAISRAGVKQVIAVGLGGIVATIVDLAVLVVLVETGTPVAVAAFVAAACGAVVHFAWSKYLGFRERSPLAIGQIARFVGVALANALLIALALQLFAVELRVPYVLAKLVGSTLVFAAWTYPAQRYLVFRSARATAPALVP